MVKIYDIYPRISTKITTEDLVDFEQPLTIANIEITGNNKKTVWLEFDGLSLKHRASKKDMFKLCEVHKTVELDDLKGKKVTLESDGDKVVIA